MSCAGVTKGLAWETSVMTWEGMRPIGDVAGGDAILLTTGPKWARASIHSCGAQRLMRITLSCARKRKEVFATAQHEWLVRNHQSRLLRKAPTSALKPGQTMENVGLPVRKWMPLERTAVARGFVFGDGYTVKAVPKRRKLRAYAQFCGDKDEAMLPFFDGLGGKRMVDKSKAPLRHSHLSGRRQRQRLKMIPRPSQAGSPDISLRTAMSASPAK